jgi:aldose 1-epimerase
MPRSALFCALVGFTAAGAAHAGTVARASFGDLPGGGRVEAITLDNGRGLTARILTLGASVQSLEVPDRAGRRADVVLGYADLGGYLKEPNFFGATVGRFANRIARGRFVLDGRTYQVPVNNGPNSLHGGTKGFDKVNWTVVETHGGASPGVTLRYVSPDGDQGYPGELTATAVYSLGADNALHVDYRATTTKPTIVNLSNHTYWNLAGEGSALGAMGHVLTVNAAAYLPTDAGSIPTGEVRPVAGTVFDFRAGKPVGRDVRDGRDEQMRFARGFDHNWVISHAAVPAPRAVARVVEPVSGRVMEVVSDQPGLQFYSGNFLDGTITGKSGRIYREGDALVLEPQRFPDAPNQPAFASARLDPGQVYENHIAFRFSTEPAR